ncbi:DUF899 domain-containing protein [Paracoccus aerodenitrificans]|uniref:DUF899 domain-containing protein n=1 Tax=Paracoccus aerodenitrificans TaxID=3017781 RepID=UPI0022F14535|nr:DUF899 domain-containing protein [Paracoccus aerodenitrificans]WBU62972.1 DUF899 domain-containing protein [Paracoccus aerodenitrificans]
MIPDIAELDDHEVVSQDEWLRARKALLDREVALTHDLDRLRTARRALPWVRVTKDYVFDGAEGKRHLGDLFAGRNQLAIQHFMLSPDSDHLCAGCSFIADHVDAARQHFEQAGLSYAAVSRAPVARIQAVKRRMGWQFAWVSSGDTDFSYDFGVSFHPGDLADGGAEYNYGKAQIQKASDMFGVSIFVRREGSDEIFHAYSTYGRGPELLMGALNWLIWPLWAAMSAAKRIAGCACMTNMGRQRKDAAVTEAVTGDAQRLGWALR